MIQQGVLKLLKTLNDIHCAAIASYALLVVLYDVPIIKEGIAE